MSVSGVAFKGLPCRNGVLMTQMQSCRCSLAECGVGVGRTGPDNVRLSPSVLCISLLFCICKEYVALL